VRALKRALTGTIAAILLAVGVAGCYQGPLKGFTIGNPRVVVVHKHILAGIPVKVTHEPEKFTAVAAFQWWSVGDYAWQTVDQKHWGKHNLPAAGHEKDLDFAPVRCLAGLYRIVFTASATDYQGTSTDGPETWIWPLGATTKDHHTGYRISVTDCKDS